MLLAVDELGRCSRGDGYSVVTVVFGGGDGFFVASLSYSSENNQLPVTISLFFVNEKYTFSYPVDSVGRSVKKKLWLLLLV